MSSADITIVLGAQFGDEGKGKLVDILTESADVCARSAGGNNAGHTIVVNGVTYDFHLLPSGLVNPKTINLIGSGVVVHVPALFDELEALEKKGLNCDGRLFVSSRAHLVLNLHQFVDKLNETALGKGKVGTTHKGIGPTYSSKASRKGLRVDGLRLDRWTEFETRFRQLVAGFRQQYGSSLDPYDEEGELAQLKELAPRLQPMVVDAVSWMYAQTQQNKRILIEGANAVMLDIDYGTYPYVTSSNACLGGAFTGLAISPFSVKRIVGVAKAYLTRVGNGPFPTEQLNEIGEYLQVKGREFGVTTGRKRRCGWLDLVMLKHSVMVNHYTSLNFTKLDVLDELETIKVATAYKLPNGEVTESFPANTEDLDNIEPIYKELPGWRKVTSDFTTYDQLPAEAKSYIQYIEEYLGVKIESVGCGPARENIIYR
ncbi:hypothetical protein DTO271G3_8537 [Paecilomyces variotii]|nr:hypothetical protein DTO271G3_8537 [Paecilomyces variotii]